MAQDTPAPLEAELITIRPTGFEPSEINRPPGRFFLSIEDRSGSDSSDLSLSSEAGARLLEVHTSVESPDWSDVLNLPPGTYLLTEAGHPEWVCRLTITTD